MVTADSSASLVRAAVAAGGVNRPLTPLGPAPLRAPLSPSAPEQPAQQLSASARYRRALPASAGELGQEGVDRALAALRQASRSSAPKGQSSVTARLVTERLRTADDALTAADVADALGISRATAQRYLAALVEERQATVGLRYGSTGRPEHLYRWSAPAARAR